MYHERDGGNYHKHHGRDGVEQEAQLDYEILSKREPGLVEYYMLEAVAVFSDECGVTAEEVGESHSIGQNQGGSHAERAEGAGKRMTHLVAEESQQKEHRQRYDEDQKG